MVLQHILYRVAFLATALIHLWWNDLVNAVVAVGLACLSSPGQSLVQSMLKLHSLVLICFVLGFCFKTVSAVPAQAALRREFSVLKFDDIKTPDGFGPVPTPYHGLVFNGFYAFQPSHPMLEGIISSADLNCAVSQPNALYGTRDNFKSTAAAPRGIERKPSIQPGHSNRAFTVHRLKIKPLNMPLGLATVSLQGLKRRSKDSEADEVLDWSVDFPAGFHDVLDVRLQEFSGTPWDGLQILFIWADFHYNDLVLDWEFCVDDMEVEVDSLTTTSST